MKKFNEIVNNMREKSEKRKANRKARRENREPMDWKTASILTGEALLLGIGLYSTYHIHAMSVNGIQTQICIDTLPSEDSPAEDVPFDVQ